MNSILEICKKYRIKNYIINDDGSIDVNGHVNLHGVNLTELPLTFNKVSGYFYSDYKKLTTLKGSPRWVGGDFSCTNNKLTSLEFGPDYVGGYFDCSNNYLIDNYCETEIGGGFYTTLKQDGLIFDYNETTNYNEWRKLYKRKLILTELFKIKYQ